MIESQLARVNTASISLVLLLISVDSHFPNSRHSTNFLYRMIYQFYTVSNMHAPTYQEQVME